MKYGLYGFNKFAVIGLGRFGTSIAQELYDMRAEVLAIDTDSEKIENAAEYTTSALIADATDKNALMMLKIRDYDAVIVAVGDLEKSVLITLAAKECGAKFVVSKAGGAKHRIVLEKIGADLITEPEADTAGKLAGRLIGKRLSDLMEIGGDYAIVEISVPDRWAGAKLSKLALRKKFNINVILAAGANGKVATPDGETVLEKKGQIVVGASKKDLQKLSAYLKRLK